MNIRVTEAEYSVLEVIWDKGQADAKTIFAELQHTGWGEPTVKTLINRLLKKAAIKFEKHGRAYVYEASISKEEFKLQESQSFLERVFSGKISNLVANFAEHEELSKGEIKELRRIIDTLGDDK